MSAEATVHGGFNPMCVGWMRGEQKSLPSLH
ncbi:MAG: hypothetical protein RLY60_739 [Pseudomonadota bacterium]|jgi:hypothetical protein